MKGTIFLCMLCIQDKIKEAYYKAKHTENLIHYKTIKVEGDIKH